MNLDEFNALPVSVKQDLVRKMIVDTCICCDSVLVHESLEPFTCLTKDMEFICVCSTCASLIFGINKFDDRCVHRIDHHSRELKRAKYEMNSFIKDAKIDPLRTVEDKQYLSRAIFRAYLSGYGDRIREENL